ncbi:MAG: hypothetical protein IJ859_04680, partial [Synergistaceae bacterium]|nr:hypothetical protein [Synergistaceae bacterium]
MNYYIYLEGIVLRMKKIFPVAVILCGMICTFAFADELHNTPKMRIEHDTMGEVKVPVEKYWGAQTQRSYENFNIGRGIETMPREITQAFGILKKAAARANNSLKPDKMTSEKLAIIEQVCDEIIAGALNE